MFSTLKMRLLLGVYVFLILSIPVASYLVSQQQTVKSKASETNIPTPKPAPKPTAKTDQSPAKELLSLSQQAAESSPTPEPSSSSPTIATSFGPTLSFKAALEGRPVDNQATKLFVGIVEGTLSTNPKFLLSFTVNLPKDGSYGNLSLAGLNPGTKYTALLKGSAQIATSSAFVMAPANTNLNSGEAINMLTGDLNEDNVINDADLSIVQKAVGVFNENADLNKDGVINAFDLAIVRKNLGQIGASGTWTSPIPQNATPSASLNSSSPTGGYWLWIPK